MQEQGRNGHNPGGSASRAGADLPMDAAEQWATPEAPHKCDSKLRPSSHLERRPQCTYYIKSTAGAP